MEIKFHVISNLKYALIYFLKIIISKKTSDLWFFSAFFAYSASVIQPLPKPCGKWTQWRRKKAQYSHPPQKNRFKPVLTNKEVPKSTYFIIIVGTNSPPKDQSGCLQLYYTPTFPSNIGRTQCALESMLKRWLMVKCVAKMATLCRPKLRVG